MTRSTLRQGALISFAALLLTACGSMPGPAAPAGPTPTPQAKPSTMVPAEMSQHDAETACIMQGSRKFAVDFGSISVTESQPVDAGYRVKMSVGGTDRTCIIAKDGFVRSLR